MKLKDMLSKKKTVKRPKPPTPIAEATVNVNDSGSLLIHLTGRVDTVVRLPASEIYKYFIKQEYDRITPKEDDEPRSWSTVQCTSQSSPYLYTSGGRSYPK